MNTFLQNMLKMNSTEQLNVRNEKEKDETKKKNETGRSGSSQRNWIRKLGNYSQSKYQLPANPVETNAMRPLDMNSVCNTYKQPSPTKTSDSPKTLPEMPDLESIIREFETGFLSPTKSQDISIEQFKQKNFVKKIVTAFEVKYKRYNDLKAEQESREKHEDSSPMIETPKRKFKVFGSNFKTSPEEPQHRTGKIDDSNDRQNVERSEERQSSRRSGIFGSPFNVSCKELKVPDSDKSPDEIKNGNNISKDRGENSKNRKKFRIFSSPSDSCGDSSASSEIYRDPVNVDSKDSKDFASNSSDVFKFDKDKIQTSNFLFSPLKVSSLDETKSMDSVDFDLTLPDPEETILLEGNALQKTSTMINDRPNYDDVDDCFVREISSVDKTPKVVGAYLKEPIEVEDTSIDWIPITGKKLPRKRSLKKLLNALTGKRTLEKKCKLFSSERNLYQEPRELQDSGYDDKSCSSSSLNSLISITEVLLQQENTYVERETRRGTLTTFGPTNLNEEEEDEVFSDTYGCSSKRNRKRLLLTEMPREEVKLDLGPAYPSSSKFLTMSLDRRMISKKTHPPSPVRPVITKLPKHPCLSKIPKHPFVTLTKMDELQETSDVQESRDSEESSVIVKNDLYEVEFRKSCLDIYSSVSCRSSSSAESNYDVPRRFLSKSENELRLDSEGKRTEPIYDVPKSSVLDRPRSSDHDRPRSSVYEDIFATRRIVQSLEFTPPSIYAVPRPLEVRCATVETTNNDMSLDNKIPRSFNDLTIDEMRTAV